MALPDTRNTTYVVGSQVKSTDLNDVQDQIISLADRTPVELEVALDEGQITSDTGTFSTALQRWSLGRLVKIMWPLQLGTALTISGVRCRIKIDSGLTGLDAKFNLVSWKDETSAVESALHTFALPQGGYSEQSATFSAVALSDGTKRYFLELELTNATGIENDDTELSDVRFTVPR